MVEIWKPVTLPTFAKHYQVSSLGRLRRVTPSKRHKQPHLLRGEVTRKGYIRMALIVTQSRQRILLHVLVAMAFLGPRPPGLQVNHKDGNKANNAVENLEYLTLADNIKHRDMTGLSRHLKGEQHWCSKLTSADVQAVREAATRGTHYQALADAYGVTKSAIYCAVKRKTWKD